MPIIIGQLKKYRAEIILGTVLLALFVASRLFRIMSLPIFTDEAIYVRWSQIAKQDASWRFISLTDGKQPMFVWLTMTVMRLVKDPLLAGRLISVFAGFVTMIGLYFVGRELFKNRWVGAVSAFLYLIFPMALVYDRMALYDSLVGTFAIWSLYLSIVLVRKVRLDVALILGMVMGGGALTKTSSFFSIPLLFMTYMLFDWKQKLWKKNLLKLIGLSVISIVITFGMYSILRLSPFYHIINDKSSIFVYPLNEWLHHPFLYFVSNLRGLFDWLITYFTPPLLIVAICSFLITKEFDRKQMAGIVKIITPLFIVVLLLNILAYIGILKAKTIEIQTLLPYVFSLVIVGCIVFSHIKKYEFWREKVILFIWFAVPFIYLSFFGRTLYPRFIFFMTLSLLPLIAFSIYNARNLFKSKVIFVIILVLFFAMPAYADYFILTDIARAPIPRSDYEQYINNWPAGGGIKEIITYLSRQSQKGKIYVASLGTFGSLPTYSVEIYLGDDKNVDKEGIYPVPSEIPKDLLEKAKKIPAYVFFSNQQEFLQQIVNWPLTLVMQYQKGDGKAYSKLYRVNSK